MSIMKENKALCLIWEEKYAKMVHQCLAYSAFAITLRSYIAYYSLHDVVNRKSESKSQFYTKLQDFN